MSRRRWTHRRLGIGATTPSDHALAETEAMLTRIGARRSTGAATLADLDPLESAFLELAYDVDLRARIAAADATPVGPDLLRITPTRSRQRRLSWQVLVPALTGGMAVFAVGVAMLLTGSSATAPTSGLSATAESKSLLTHADALLTTAATAAPAERPSLVREAKADLNHVTKLLPLAPPQARPQIRQRLKALGQRIPKPAAAPTPYRSDPPRRHRPQRQPPQRSVTADVPSDSATESTDDTVTTPTTTGRSDTEQTEIGTIPPPRRGPGSVLPPPPGGGGRGPRPNPPGTAQSMPSTV